MNGGDGTYSYTKNSTAQRKAATAVKDLIQEAVMENLDIEKVLCGGTTFAIADLGCSVGPNTFYAVEALIETVESKYRRQVGQLEYSDNLEFQVLFNDQIGNDFNTLFASLPHRRSYFAAAVQGSFHGRLLPSSSVHVAYSSYAIHWLSKVPVEVQLKGSPAWNAGRVHYSGASDTVVKAFADQFEKDMEIFLGARAQEIAPGGLIVIVVPGVPDGVVEYCGGTTFLFIEHLLASMVEEGVIGQEQVDSFNIANVYPCVKDMRRVVERNGCFEIVKMEYGEIAFGDELGLESVIMHIRAIFEGSMANHFGKEMVDQLFNKAMEAQHKLEFARIIHSSGVDRTAGQILAALKRI